MIVFLAAHASLNARLELSPKGTLTIKSTPTNVFLAALAQVFARLELRKKHNHHKNGKERQAFRQWRNAFLCFDRLKSPRHFSRTTTREAETTKSIGTSKASTGTSGRSWKSKQIPIFAAVAVCFRIRS